MSNEETGGPEDAGELLRWAWQTQRNIDFIIQQQARFNADLGRVREEEQRRQEDWERRQARADEKWAHTENGIRALLAVAEIHEREINTIKDAQDRTDRQMAETDRRMAETDKRLNALINFVERRVADGRNGGQKA